MSLVAGVLAVARFEPEAGPHAPKPVDVLKSEAPNEESEPPNKVGAASTSFGGVGWSASQGEQSPGEDLDTGTVAARAGSEAPELRDARTRVFRNDDGTLTVQAALAPIHYATEGGWKRISNALSQDPDRPGWVRTTANSWTVGFGPTGNGLRLEAPEGTIRMAPVLPDGADPVDPEIVSNPDPAEPKSAEEALLEPAIPEPGVVRYEGVWPGADLRYEVRTTGLKEDILLASPEGPSAFPFDLSGAEFATAQDGGLNIAGELGESFRVPPPTVTGADGSDLTEPSGVRYELEAASSAEETRVTVASTGRGCGAGRSASSPSPSTRASTTPCRRTAARSPWTAPGAGVRPRGSRPAPGTGSSIAPLSTSPSTSSG